MAKISSIFKEETKKAAPHPKRVTRWIHYTKLRDNQGQYRYGRTDEERGAMREAVRGKEEALADLIEADGEVLQDLLVRKIDTDEYELIAGHHRRNACKILVEERGKEQFAMLPCIVKDVSDVRSAFSCFSSNGYAKKTDYEIMCELEGMKHLLETYPEEFPELQTGRMVEKLAKQLNMKKSTVGEYTQIAGNLGEKAMEGFRTGQIKKSAAVELSALPEEEQESLVEQGMTSYTEIKTYKAGRKENVTAEESPCPPGQPDNVPESGTEKPEGNVPKSGTGKPEGNVPESGTEKPEEDVPNFGTFPELKNPDEREAFVNAYQSWDVWCKNEYTEETFYRYDLPDGAAIIVKEYPYADYWNPDKERTGTKLYLLLPDMRHFKNAESCMTEIKEHLKGMGREGRR